MLAIEDLSAWYGAIRAVRAASLRVEGGQVLAVLGPNGAGKSTLANAICGLHRSRSGHIRLDELDLSQSRATETARSGVVLVPQGRRIFGSCTVAEHVCLAGVHARHDALGMELLLDHFPRLRDRWTIRARQLSGGEQQMLAITRAVLLGPRVLVLDEPTEGLAPAIVDAVSALIRTLRETGVAVILMEQPGPLPQALADRVVRMDRGIVSTPASALEGDLR